MAALLVKKCQFWSILALFFVNFFLFLSFRRKELTKEQEDYTFAQIGRVISDEWKKVEGEPLEKLKEEAERLNFEGVRKLPKDGSGNILLHIRSFLVKPQSSFSTLCDLTDFFLKI